MALSMRLCIIASAHYCAYPNLMKEPYTKTTLLTQMTLMSSIGACPKSRHDVLFILGVLPKVVDRGDGRLAAKVDCGHARCPGRSLCLCLGFRSRLLCCNPGACHGFGLRLCLWLDFRSWRTFRFSLGNWSLRLSLSLPFAFWCHWTQTGCQVLADVSWRAGARATEVKRIHAQHHSTLD